MRLRTYIHRLHLNALLLTGFVFSLAGGAWLLFGVPFEDSLWVWIRRAALFSIGLFLMIASRKSMRESKRRSSHTGSK